MNNRQQSVQYYERLGGLEGRMDTVEGSLRDLNTKVDRIVRAVSEKPSFEPVKILTFIVLLVSVIGSFGAGVIYISSATNSSRIAVAEFKIDEVWKAGRWVPGTTIVAKSTPRTDAATQ